MNDTTLLPPRAPADVPADGAADHRCSRCPRGVYCLPLGLAQPDAERLDRILRVSRPLQAGQRLYFAGGPFEAVYSVRSGAFKTTTIDCDGYEQVVGFHLPGEIMGLDGLFTGVRETTAEALTVSTVCSFPYRQLFELGLEIPRIMERLLGLMSKDLLQGQAAVGDYMAEERLAAFFLGLAMRVYPRGEFSTRIILPMSRADTANHLRLAGETLSRILARFQDQGLIALQHRVLNLTNVEGLQYLARRLPKVQL